MCSNCLHMIFFMFFNETATTYIYTLSLHDALPISIKLCRLDTPIIFIEARINLSRFVVTGCAAKTAQIYARSEERFSRNAETDLVCRLLLEKKNLSIIAPSAAGTQADTHPDDRAAEDTATAA